MTLALIPAAFILGLVAGIIAVLNVVARHQYGDTE